jgi:hypothetical protein
MKYEQSRPWHTLYCGLGWEENPYGVTWSDVDAKRRAKEIAPTLTDTVQSKEYFSVIKSEYFRVVKENPRFFLGSYYRKFTTILKASYNYFKGILKIFFN